MSEYFGGGVRILLLSLVTMTRCHVTMGTDVKLGVTVNLTRKQTEELYQ